MHPGKFVVVGLVLAAASVAQAQSRPQVSKKPAPSHYTERGTPLPRQVTSTGAGYVCGGIGQGEQLAIKSMAPQFDLMLTFATTSGQYLAYIDVELSSRDRTVLSLRCEAPMLLVNLPADGIYSVHARNEDQELRRQFTLSSSRATRALVLRWPHSESDVKAR